MTWQNIFRFSRSHIPRWVIFQIDIMVCILSMILAYLLIFDFNFQLIPPDVVFRTMVLVLVFRTIAFLITKTYAGIIKFTSSQDAVRIFIALTFSSLAIEIINILNYSSTGLFLVSHSILIIDYLLSLVIMTATRLAYKIVYNHLLNSDHKKVNVIIYGAGRSGIITKRTLYEDMNINYKVVAFFDDDISKSGVFAEGVRVYHSGNKLEEFLKKHKVDELIISIQNISQKRKKEIIETCLSFNIKVRNVPPVNKWINGELSFNQIKSVKIEDLLEREQIKLDKVAVGAQISGKRVVVTGAAGSIGSELVRQILEFNPERVYLIDQAESPLYDLENSLKGRFGHLIEIIICDISNQVRMEKIFHAFKPHLVFHAAAYKHVPMMESNPSESVATNVLGSKILADLSLKYKVEKFVFVSTDKAVNPTNIMGATKRVAELYIQSLNDKQEKEKSEFLTKFVITRFGNVLGSNGSVIPLFTSQIANGGPVQVTHPEITRYFMTISEACELVLEASAMGKGGEIFVFDMGQSVKIVDLAKKMIKLSGLKLGKDIQIVFTGLRPGEKMYEELLNNEENTLATHHPKILIGKVGKHDFVKINEQIQNLATGIYLKSNEELVMEMKNIVAEFISNNSIYEELDNRKTVNGCNSII